MTSNLAATILATPYFDGNTTRAYIVLRIPRGCISVVELNAVLSFYFRVAIFKGRP